MALKIYYLFQYIDSLEIKHEEKAEIIKEINEIINLITGVK